MRLADKIATMARRGAPLPYLRRVAYLQSHGTEYIDSGVSMSNDVGMMVEFEKTATGDVIIVGANNGKRCWINATNARVYAGWDGIINLTESISLNTRYIAGNNYLNSRTGYINLPSPHEITSSFWLSNVGDGPTIYIFADHRQSTQSADLKFTGRIYNVQLSKSEDVVRNLIPVISLDGEPCMYDEVSGQLFYNKGTGEFTWGELDASSAPVSSRGGGTKCLTPRRSYRRLARPSARFCAHSQEWEVAA